MILGAWSIYNGILHGRKNESAPFVFSQLKTEESEIGCNFLTAVDT